MLRIMTDAPPLQRLKIDLTLDLLCPYSLVGLEQMLHALTRFRSLHPTFSPELRLLPYQLNPTLTNAPESRRANAEKRLGKERANEDEERLAEKLETLGIIPALDGLISSSHLAHRLLTFTLFNHPERQLPLAMDLLYAYHRDGRHLSDLDLLSDLAVHHNVFPHPFAARDFLDSEVCDAQVRRAYITSRRLGVTGVPFFVFQDRYAASGAMGVDEFERLIDDIMRREELNSASPSPTSTAASPSAQLPASAKHDLLQRPPPASRLEHPLPIPLAPSQDMSMASIASPRSATSHEDR